MNSVSVIIVAAGEGRRFGKAKQFSVLKGRTVLDWSLESFEAHEAVCRIILVLRKGIPRDYYLKKFKKITAIADGGKTRQDSVLAGFNRLSSPDPDFDFDLNFDTEIVLVHDAARPLVSKDLISRIIETTKEKGAAVPLIPIEDTVKETTGRFGLRTVDRKKMFRAQTPQGFLYPVLEEALKIAEKNKVQGTDESYLVEMLDKPVQGIPGERRNIKITAPEDLRIAEVLFED